MPEDNPGVQVPPQVASIDHFEHAVEKLVRALEKVDARNKTEDAKLEATKHVEAEKSKIRASKLEYKLVDEMYVPCSVVTTMKRWQYLGAEIENADKQTQLEQNFCITTSPSWKPIQQNLKTVPTTMRGSSTSICWWVTSVRPAHRQRPVLCRCSKIARSRTTCSGLCSSQM